MVQIMPAILALDEESYRSRLKKIEDSELFKDGWLHVDFLDGLFVKDQSVGAEILEKYPTEIKVEAHLMVQDPLSMFDQLKKEDAKRVVFHLEVGNTKEIISQAKSLGFEVGLVINPETEPSRLQPNLASLDSVLVMSVHPGAQGQKFIPESVERIKAVASLRSQNNLHFLIGVDGGVSEDVVGELVEVGADYLVIGSHLIRGNIDENLQKIKKAINY